MRHPGRIRCKWRLASWRWLSNDLAAAAAHFDTALTIDPDSYDAVAGRVNVSVAQKNTADAVRRVDARIAKHPKDAASLALAGRTYAIAGDLVKSEALLQQSLAADSGYMPAYYFLGQLYVRQNRLGDARQRYEEMVARQPDNVGAHTMVAMLLQAENKQAEAKARYEKILQIDSHAVVAANNLAFMHAEAGTDLDIALQLAQTAISAFPDEPDFNDTLGWVYLQAQHGVAGRRPAAQERRPRAEEPDLSLPSRHGLPEDWRAAEGARDAAGRAEAQPQVPGGGRRETRPRRSRRRHKVTR